MDPLGFIPPTPPPPLPKTFFATFTSRSTFFIPLPVTYTTVSATQSLTSRSFCCRPLAAATSGRLTICKPSCCFGAAESSVIHFEPEPGSIRLARLWTAGCSRGPGRAQQFQAAARAAGSGVAANCTWGLTVSDPGAQPRPVLRLRLSKLANSLT